MGINDRIDFVESGARRVVNATRTVENGLPNMPMGVSAFAGGNGPIEAFRWLKLATVFGTSPRTASAYGTKLNQGTGELYADVLDIVTVADTSGMFSRSEIGDYLYCRGIPSLLAASPEITWEIISARSISLWAYATAITDVAKTDSTFTAITVVPVDNGKSFNPTETVTVRKTYADTAATFTSGSYVSIRYDYVTSQWLLVDYQPYVDILRGRVLSASPAGTPTVSLVTTRAIAPHDGQYPFGFTANKSIDVNGVMGLAVNDLVDAYVNKSVMPYTFEVMNVSPTHQP